MIPSHPQHNERPSNLSPITKVNFIPLLFSDQRRDESFLENEDFLIQEGSVQGPLLEQESQVTRTTLPLDMSDYLKLDVKECGRDEVSYILQIPCETRRENVNGQIYNVSSPRPLPSESLLSTSIAIPLQGILAPIDDLLRAVIFPPRRSRSWSNSYPAYQSVGGDISSLSLRLNWISRNGRSVFDPTRISYELHGIENGDGTFVSIVLILTVFSERCANNVEPSLEHSITLSQLLNRRSLHAVHGLRQWNQSLVSELRLYGNGNHDMFITNGSELNVDGPVGIQLAPSEATHDNVAPSADIEGEIQPSSVPFSYRVRGAQPLEMERFPVFQITVGVVGRICPICQCQFLEGQEARRLPCGTVHHEFHIDCIDGWMSYTFTCPVDRTDFSC